MITCGQLRCILATSAACRAILGMGRHRKGERGRGRVGFRPRSSPPCFIPLPMVIFHPLPLPCGPSPGEDHFVFGSSLLCFFASAAHLATGFRSAVFPLPRHLPRMGISFIFLFFSWLPLFFCVILEVVWRVIQPTADVRRRVFLFRCEGGQERVTLTISCGQPMPAVQGALTVLCRDYWDWDPVGTVRWYVSRSLLATEV